MTRRTLIAGMLVALAGTAAGGAALARDEWVPEGVRVLRGRKYVRNGHERQKLDLYLPESTRPLPVLVWIHGGGWSGGDRSNPPILDFTGDGYAVVSVGYRLSGDAIFPAQIHDLKAAIRWLRANSATYNLDPDRIGVVGASAGGHLAALLGTSGGHAGLEGDLGNPEQSSEVQCVVDLFGPSDLTRMGRRRDQKKSPEARLIGGPIDRNRGRAERAAPLRYVDAGDAPFLILHGDADPVVPLEQSRRLRDALRDAGVEATLLTEPGGGHGPPEYYLREHRSRIASFLRSHLRR